MYIHPAQPKGEFAHRIASTVLYFSRLEDSGCVCFFSLLFRLPIVFSFSSWNVKKQLDYDYAFRRQRVVPQILCLA